MQFFGVNCSGKQALTVLALVCVLMHNRLYAQIEAHSEGLGAGIDTKLQDSCTKVVDAADIRDNAVASCTLYAGIFGLLVLVYELIATQSAVEERQYATLVSSYVLIVYVAKVEAVLSAQSEMQRCLVRAQATHGDTAVQKELTRLEGLGVRKIRLVRKPPKL